MSHSHSPAGGGPSADVSVRVAWADDAPAIAAVQVRAPSPADDVLRRKLREVDINQLTPLQALTLLAELKSEAQE